MSLKLSPQCCCQFCETDMRLPECALEFWLRDVLVVRTFGFPGLDVGIYTFCGVFNFLRNGNQNCGFVWLSPTTKDNFGLVLENTGSVTEPRYSLNSFPTGPRACGEAGATQVGFGSLGANTASTAFIDFMCNEVPIAIAGGFYGNFEVTLLA